ncbi:MarR family transcriptional regulator [Bacillus sp. CMF12]|uniref:MarR family winged helix-turn-helix transcriptional regulator n=1 Tax=Bacillaceae TaxID=186817 RepID=UPI001FB1CB0F|nr:MULTISPECIES: MarR family transcriptional regulator [Bacillaceae]UOE53752.1 MarR family transcriptional regulator [Cytobacillus oceanisediminis]USK48198.1 MarR family transcriptional regulator [Bacillus sp. CMF12]
MNILLKQQTLLVIRALYFCMEKNWAELEKKFKLTPAQQHILFLLGTHNQKLSPTQISELGCWHLSTVTRLLKPLKEKGLIEITANKEQLRYKCVAISKSGKELLDQIMDEVKGMEQFPLNMSHLSENELMSFLEYGQRILGVQKGDTFKKMLIDARVENYDYA